MQFRRVTLYCCLLASIYMLSFVFPALCYDQQEAEAKVREAENKVLESYSVALEAEKARANVSELLITLNEAGWLLSRAKLAYEYGYYDLAVGLANQSLALLEGFIDDANALKGNAERAGFFDFALNFVGSAVGAMAIMIGGYVLWNFLKKCSTKIGVKA